MSQETTTRIVLCAAGQEAVDPALKARANRTFHRAIRKSGGFTLTPDGTLAYIDEEFTVDS